MAHPTGASSLGGFNPPPKPTFEYAPPFRAGGPEAFGFGYDAFPPWPSPPDSVASRRRKTDKRKKHRSRTKHRKKRKVAAYILQIIGVLCFILAAVRSYEPLVGVGFTLVLIGYERKARRGTLADFFGRSGRRDGSLESASRRQKKKKGKKRREVKVEGTGSETGDA